jgi:hypothetical protein
VSIPLCQLVHANFFVPVATPVTVLVSALVLVPTPVEIKVALKVYMKLLSLCNFSAEEEIDGGNYFNRLESWIYF